MKPLFSSICVASLLLASCLLPSAALAAPLDLSDPTPRTVQIEFDEDTTDIGAIGSLYGPPLEASYASDGVTATITVPGAALEALVDAVFVGTATAIPGSFSNYVLEIDVATGDVLSANVAGDIDVILLGTLGLTQTAASTIVGGYEYIDFFGFLIPEFCTGGAACTLVPGLPFDAATGAANAVGSITTSSPLIPVLFSPFGDVRLSEQPAPAADCTVATSQPSYTTGQQITLSALSFAGSPANNLPNTRLRLQLSFGAAFTASIINGGPLTLPAGFAFDAGPVGLFAVPSSMPRGAWSFRCALEEFTTGEILAEDFADFTVE